jgi:Fur family ferric uptake transcriptional regulator
MSTERRLRDAGLRVTAQRVAVLEVLDRSDGHLTADEVRAAARSRIGSVSVQAVYDVLAVITRAGLARCIETPGHPARYESRVGDNHHHFVCRRCGRTIDIDCAAGDAPCLLPAALPKGFEIDEAEVTYWGVCSDCHNTTVAGGR